jgi:LytS/YehU family sensor histidine kinase
MLFKNDGFNPIIREEAARVAVPVLVGGFVAGLWYAALMTTFIYYRRSQWVCNNCALAKIANQECLARQLTDAKLKLMLAQVEPHFLFNTLARVQQLAEGQAPDAAKLASQLISFCVAACAACAKNRPHSQPNAK